MSAEDLDELLRSLHPECFVTSQGDPDIVVTPTTVDKFSTTADKAAMIEASPTATLVVTLAQLPQLPGLIPRGDGETGAVWAEQWERIHRMKDVADKWTLAEDTILLEGVATIGPKWRRIAEKLPERSGNAVRNRFKRLEKLEAARRHNDTTGVVATWATCLRHQPRCPGGPIHRSRPRPPRHPSPHPRCPPILPKCSTNQQLASVPRPSRRKRLRWHALLRLRA